MTAMPPPTPFRRSIAKGPPIPSVALCIALGLSPSLARGQHADTGAPTVEATKRQEPEPADPVEASKRGQDADKAPSSEAPKRNQEALKAPPVEATKREQELDKGPPPEALAHYHRGREHYQAGRYREALIELEVAMQLDPSSPNLVYNVARVYELLGEIDHAIAFYKRYRSMLPADEHAERERTTLTLLRLEGAREQVSGAPPAPPPPPPVEQRKRGSADATFWVFASTTVLTLAGAGATGLLALDAHKRAESFVVGEDGSAARRARIIDQGERLALASDSMALAGATLAVTTLLLYVLRDEPATPPARATLDVRVGSESAFIGLRGAL